jgi:tripartite-type tricarboxylate transporter receptor subunit TctC
MAQRNPGIGGSTLFLCVVFAALVSARLAAAQSLADFYRGRTVTISVGSSAGGGYDLHARVLAKYLGRHLPGAPVVVVKNAPGG